MKESELTRRIVNQLRSRGCFVSKIAAGPWQATGLPDIVACYKGRFIGLEVKVPGRERTLTKRQRHSLLKIKEAGGISAVVTSSRQAWNIIWSETTESAETFKAGS